jgi:pimeloyl-ACP methyl ester carboxylesterase
MAVMVLVHGAWHGGWCWDRVRPLLAGTTAVEVVTPTLTGLAGRRRELMPDVGLHTHVDDVVRVIDRVAEPVVLVGHSAAGLVVREAADRRPEAVAHLVLVDGWVGADGTSLLDLAPDWMAGAITAAAAEHGDGWRVPPPDPALVGIEDPHDVTLLRTRLTDHPLAAFTESTVLSGAVDRVPTTAIVAEPSALPFRHLADEAGWPTIAITGGHDLMLTSPEPLASALLRLAPSVGRSV